MKSSRFAFQEPELLSVILGHTNAQVYTSCLFYFGRAFRPMTELSDLALEGSDLDADIRRVNGRKVL